MSLVLPPLRDRQGDIPLLVHHFLGSDWNVDPEVMEALSRYRWPGNVRQLSNALDRATVLAEDSVILVEDLPREVLQSSTPAMLDGHQKAAGGDDLASLERSHIISVLQKEKGNKAKAARALGIHRRKLYRLIERLQIEVDPA
jgi:DNA-binding NtrC family response regulator